MASQKVKEQSSELRSKLVDKILELMEQDGIEWVKGFDGSMFLAHNPLSPTKYRGVNRYWLATIMMKNHYKDPRFCTYKQALEAGWHVKRESHGFKVECWRELPFVHQ